MYIYLIANHCKYINMSYSEVWEIVVYMKSVQ